MGLACKTIRTEIHHAIHSTKSTPSRTSRTGFNPATLAAAAAPTAAAAASTSDSGEVSYPKHWDLEKALLIIGLSRRSVVPSLRAVSSAMVAWLPTINSSSPNRTKIKSLHKVGGHQMCHPGTAVPG